MHAWPVRHDAGLHAQPPIASHTGVEPVHEVQLAPQCVESLATHVPPHLTWPAGQFEHAPALQFSPAAHATQVGPQCMASTGWHTPAQRTSPVGQMQRPAPSQVAPLAAEQDSPVPQKPKQPFDPHWRPVQSIG